MVCVNEKLLKKADEFGISVEFISMDRFAFFMAESKTIFLNINWAEKNDGAFHISHELGHFIKEHNSYKKYYYATNNSMSKMEYEADKIAIDLLLDIYFDEFDFENEQVNPITFMDMFNISTYLEKYVIEGMKKHCLSTA